MFSNSFEENKRCKSLPVFAFLCIMKSFSCICIILVWLFSQSKVLYTFPTCIWVKVIYRHVFSKSALLANQALNISITKISSVCIFRTIYTLTCLGIWFFRGIFFFATRLAHKYLRSHTLDSFAKMCCATYTLLAQYTIYLYYKLCAYRGFSLSSSYIATTS